MNDMDKELQKSTMDLKQIYIWNRSEQCSRKNRTGKRQAVMAYMDSGFKKIHPSRTDWLFNRVDAKKKQI